jgi:hypothetical protein
VPASEKLLVSLFEPHADIIVKGGRQAIAILPAPVRICVSARVQEAGAQEHCTSRAGIDRGAALRQYERRSGARVSTINASRTASS